MTQDKFSPETRKAILGYFNVPDAKQEYLLSVSDARFAVCLLKGIKEDAALLRERLLDLGIKPPSDPYELTMNIIIQVNCLLSAYEGDEA